MKDSTDQNIGEIPAEWRLSKIKYVSAFMPFCDTRGLKEDTVVGYAPMECIKNGFFIQKSAEYGSIPASLTSYKSGDIVMAKVTPCFENGNIAIMTNVASDIGFGSSELFVFRATNIATKFLFYWLQNYGFVNMATASMTGMGGLKRVSSVAVNNAIIGLPSQEEQQKIILFLDQKTDEIAAIKADIQSQIDTLEQYKKSVIFAAVSRGLSYAEMKDTDSDVWSKIPRNWELKDIKYLFEIVKRIAGKEGYDILSVTQKGLRVKDISTNEGQIAENYSGYQLVYPTDYVMNHMDLLTGWVDCSVMLGVTSPDYRVFRLLDKVGNDLSFFQYVMQCCYSCHIFYSLGQGVSTLGRWRLQTSAFLNFKIPVPPLEEQREIVAYLDAKCAGIDSIIADKHTQLDVIDEYKKSLIFEYVTGKKAVTYD